MKRLAAILLLLIMLFNVFGYQVVIFSIKENNAIALKKKLDKKDYREADLISVKTKLHLPYYQGSQQFERVYGSINIDGKDYEFVKRRVFNDTLELLCLPDTHKTELNSVKNEIAKSAADHQPTAPGKKGSSVIKINLSEYLPSPLSNFSVENTVTAKMFYVTNSSQLLSGFGTRPEHPPQSA